MNLNSTFSLSLQKQINQVSYPNWINTRPLRRQVFYLVDMALFGMKFSQFWRGWEAVFSDSHKANSSHSKIPNFFIEIRLEPI